KGRVYLGDEQGGLHAFAVKDGAKLWSHAIKDRISACPAVCPAGILFAGEQGALALVGFDGKVRWTRTLEVEEVHQPVATESQVLVPTSDGLRVLRQSDGAPDPRFPVQGQGGHVVSVVPYGDQICFVSYHISLQESQGLSFTDAGGNAHVWAPAPAEDD
ncbi:MAG: PQQ-binding-like beta-propeller repeat protein, partial [Planctomycetota bacterium]